MGGGERRRRLLVGWEGTLSPVPEEAAGLPEPEVLRPWMEAARDIACGLSGAVDGGARLPLEQLTEGLRRRLMGVYATAVERGVGRLTGVQRRGVERVAGGVARDWEAGVSMFARRIRREGAALARWMGVAALPEVEGLRAASSDVHGRGGAAIEMRFGGGVTVFYKPRPVTGEELWAELQERLAGVDPEAAVRAARTLTCGDEDGAFGWMECLPEGGCEEARHWRGAGALLCVAAATGLSDLHMANVIATGCGPAVVDAECLGGWVADGTEEAMSGTGLLPCGAEEAMPDVSGLFGGGAAVEGVAVPRWGDGVVMGGARLLEQRNRVAGDRRPLACLPEMLEGFRCAEAAMVRLRDELLAEGGWVSRMETEHAPRVLFRSTLEYGFAMSGSLSLAVVGSEAARERALRCGLAERKVPGGLEASEVRALARMCVPRFTRLGGEILDGEGRVCGFEGLSGGLDGARDGGVRGRLERMTGEGAGGGVEEALAGVLFRAKRGPCRD